MAERTLVTYESIRAVVRERDELRAENERLLENSYRDLTENERLNASVMAHSERLREQTERATAAEDEVERLRDFAKLVVDMRNAQKAYFRDRRPSDLTESKRLEKLVDQWPAQTLW
jgi:hypothetical protein